MATTRTLIGIQNIIIMAQCCSGNLAHSIIDDERQLIDTTCDQKNLIMIQESISVLYNYTPSDADNNITDAEAERVIENLYELCECLESIGDDVIDTDTSTDNC